uniref:Uncharacterized protein n=1 Tax=Anguilla anguilla TaxID=7936 RepID=A0A0E9PDX4_ANGAN
MAEYHGGPQPIPQHCLFLHYHCVPINLADLGKMQLCCMLF